MPSATIDRLRFLLLQVRNADDLMLRQETEVFALALGCAPQRLTTVNLLERLPTPREIGAADLTLVGGSGHYSATAAEPWIEPILELFHSLCARRAPLFASCWGFQAIARALGGVVVHDIARAELGTLPVRLTEAGKLDPLFGPLGDSFYAPMGHEDQVDALPPGALLLASSERVTNQAFRLAGAPIYATQFHPELNRAALLGRVAAYPQYIRKIAKQTSAEFTQNLVDTPEAAALLPRFVEQVFG